MSLFKKKGAHQWRGVIEEYRDRLPVSKKTPVVTLREGGTPLVAACVLSEMLDNEVWLKVEGANPTGSFKDRGMTMAMSKALEDGAKAVICASTGNTSASAAAMQQRLGCVRLYWCQMERLQWVNWRKRLRMVQLCCKFKETLMTA